MIEEHVRKLTYKLKLYGIHEHFQRHAEETASISFHPNDFLKLVLGRTKEHYPKNRKATTLLGRAKFRSCVDDWDSSFNRGLVQLS